MTAVDTASDSVAPACASAPADGERLRREDIVLSMIPRTDLGRVLHLGCGNGSLTVRLPGRTIVGLDPEAALIQAARRRCPEDARFAFAVADALTLGDAVDTEPFDLVVVTDALVPSSIGLAFPVAWIAVAERVRSGGFVVYDREHTSGRPSLPTRRLDRLIYAESDRLNLLELYRP